MNISRVKSLHQSDPYALIKRNLGCHGIRDVDIVEDEDGSTVTITGTVALYYHKQLVQGLLMQEIEQSGRTIKVDNQIEVQ